MLELKLLGVPEVRLDGQERTFVRRGSIALLAYLALSKRACARAVVATWLAGDKPQDQARKLLSNLLVDLRQQLGGYIVTTRQAVSFNHTLPHALDVVEFQTRRTEFLYGGAAKGLDTAIALYRGEFLEGVTPTAGTALESWQVAQCEELRAEYTQLLRKHIDVSLERTAWDRGIESARRLLEQEPWQEEIHRQLIAMLARSGQRHAAISQYMTCRRLLREEMGLEPSPDTVALFRRIRGAAIPPPHNLPHAMDPLVGREALVRRLGAFLADPACQLVTVTGPAGSGKSRLALEVARSFTASGDPPPEQPFPHGVFHVDLADVVPPGPFTSRSAADADCILTRALCSTLLSTSVEHPTEALARLASHLSQRAVLLTLDNVDQIGGTASLLRQLLARAPHAKLLVTSRLPLRLCGERVVHLGGLPVPASEVEIETSASSALFLQEARRVSVGYELPRCERSSLVRLCQLLGGFPLALILAARWVPVLPCSVLLTELCSGIGLDILATTDADLPERHRSISRPAENLLAEMPGDGRVRSRVLTSVLNGPSRNGTPERLELYPLPRGWADETHLTARRLA